MKKLLLLLGIFLVLLPKSSFSKDWQDIEFYSNNVPYKLSDYKGKTLLVMFWATWCPHCKNQMPALSMLKNLYSKTPDFEVLSISIDEEGEDAVKNYLNTYNLNNLYSFVDVNSNLLHSFGFNVIPTIILISKQGEVLGYYRGLQDFNVEYLDSILQKNDQK